MAEQTRTRILDATLGVISRRGLGGLTLEDVGDAADVSRQTVYRHFGNRDGLIAAVVLREEQAMVDRISDAAAREPDLHAALRAAVLVTLQLAADHPLLQRLLETEPEALLPFLTSSRGPVLPAARPILAGVLRERVPGVDPDRLRRLADAATRLLISYAINPSDEAPEVVAETLASLVVSALEAD